MRIARVVLASLALLLQLVEGFSVVLAMPDTSNNDGAAWVAMAVLSLTLLPSLVLTIAATIVLLIDATRHHRRGWLISGLVAILLGVLLPIVAPESLYTIVSQETLDVFMMTVLTALIIPILLPPFVLVYAAITRRANTEPAPQLS
jgi:cytochrome bd-type quinol oxidase subunit 2